jgi:hypothetical protein
VIVPFISGPSLFGGMSFCVLNRQGSYLRNKIPSLRVYMALMDEDGDKQCLLRELIARTVTSAHRAKRERDLAIEEQKDSAACNFALKEARRWERHAVEELIRLSVHLDIADLQR